MQTIHPLRTENVPAATQRLLDAATDAGGVVSNMIKTLAQAPRALEAYVGFRKALSGSSLPPEIREQIALVVAQTNLSEYSLAEHTHLASRLGLKKEDILASRAARAMDKKTDAVLRFARDLAARKGDNSMAELRDRGCSDADIIDVIALVALNAFENYLNDVARTDLDFPTVGRTVKAA